MSTQGLAGLVVELLRRASALTALDLLQIVRCMYEQHEHPKEFVVKYGLTPVLRAMASGDRWRPGEAVLVRKQAQALLDAFQINTVL